jgi:hypothetical protein
MDLKKHQIWTTALLLRDFENDLKKWVSEPGQKYLGIKTTEN